MESKDYRLKRSGKMRLAFGKARFTSEITQESEMLMFGVLHFGDHNLHGGVALYRSEDAYRELGKATREAFSRSDLAATIHCLDEGFAGHTYSLKNLFRDEQRKVLTEVLESTLEHSFTVEREMYEDEAQLLRFMSDCGIPIPQRAESRRRSGVEWSAAPGAGRNRTGSLCHPESARRDAHRAAFLWIRTVSKSCCAATSKTGGGRFFEDPKNLALLTKFRENLEAARSLPFPLVLWSVQNRCYEVLQNIDPQVDPREGRRVPRTGRRRNSGSGRTCVSLRVTGPRP